MFPGDQMRLLRRGCLSPAQRGKCILAELLEIEPEAPGWGTCLVEGTTGSVITE